MKKLLAVLVVVILPMIAGCGGGGGSSAKPTGATLRLSSLGALPVGTAVSGIVATVELPTGVTVKTNQDGTADATVVVGSGLLAGPAGTMGPVIYTAATPAAKAKLDFTIASTAVNGVGVGEYVTITVILNDTNPPAADYRVTAFKAYDMSFAEITALTAQTALSVY